MNIVVINYKKETNSWVLIGDCGLCGRTVTEDVGAEKTFRVVHTQMALGDWFCQECERATTPDVEVLPCPLYSPSKIMLM